MLSYIYTYIYTYIYVYISVYISVHIHIYRYCVLFALLLYLQINILFPSEFVLTPPAKTAEEPHKPTASLPAVAGARSGSCSEDSILDETKKERTKSLTK